MTAELPTRLGAVMRISANRVAILVRPGNFLQWDLFDRNGKIGESSSDLLSSFYREVIFAGVRPKVDLPTNFGAIVKLDDGTRAVLTDPKNDAKEWRWTVSNSNGDMCQDEFVIEHFESVVFSGVE